MYETTGERITKEKSKELDRLFTYHTPKPEDRKKYNDIRNQAKTLASTIERLCPDSAEKSDAIKHLDQAVMLANASIARNE